MPAQTLTRSQIATTAALIVGALVWALAPLVTDKKEAWGSTKYYNYTALISSFVIALACYKWMEVIGGWYFGQLLWFAAFGSKIFGGDFNLLVLSLALAMSLPVPLVGSLAGCAVRWLAAYVIKKRAG